MKNLKSETDKKTTVNLAVVFCSQNQYVFKNMNEVS
ncbi:hypothetical protein LRU_00736 [Ligilactobacillus ruminis SPM0211]|uniref:Uncharacterized protein n=1 Tax=Ligilactobacillus ruminis SPM0211 TaxID=1040964 RepID=F7QXK5_9LACO|nr:hypothetical protein LRU_00736 [Ligilactobacillus ruminis SPM0211]